MIKQYFLDYEAMTNDFTITLGRLHAIAYHDEHPEQSFTVTLSDTGAETMTGGRVRRVQRYVTGDTFMVTYGDGVSDIDIGKLLAFHHAHGKLATISTNRPFSRFGVMDVDSSGRVEEFREKPQLDGWANMGYFVFNRKVFDYLQGGDDLILEQEPLEKLAADGQLMAYRHEGFFYAMDTYREFVALNDLWKSGQAPWKVWE
jgi:glucose-1-phosphate cytidylyltransferase